MSLVGATDTPPPRPLSAQELKAVIEVEREHRAFLVYRDRTGRQRIVQLDETEDSITLGRGEGVDVRFDWDVEVSGVHAELRPLGGEWTIVDDGLSANGTWVNGTQLDGRRRLRDADLIRLGRTQFLFRRPVPDANAATIAGPRLAGVSLTDQQRRVLVALCRPLRAHTGFAMPASNRQIADELVLSIEAVKTHMRTLFNRFGVEQLPQNEKRLRLAERAIDSGTVAWRDV